MLTSRQIRAARGFLGWSARELAERAGVHLTTVQRLERPRGLARATVETLDKIAHALQAAGVEFTGDEEEPGVRLREK